MERDTATNKEIDKILEKIADTIDTRITRKGKSKWVGPHEILGNMTEEYDELLDAVHANDKNGVKEELMDILIVALWGLISLNKS